MIQLSKYSVAYRGKTTREKKRRIWGPVYRLFFLIRCWRSLGLRGFFSSLLLLNFLLPWLSPKACCWLDKNRLFKHNKEFCLKSGSVSDRYEKCAENLPCSFPNFKIFVVIFSRIDVTFVISVFPKGQSRDRFFNNCKYILWGVVFFASLYFLRWFGPRNPTNPFLASYFWKSKSLRIGWLLSLLKMLLLQIEKRCLLLQGSPSVPPEKFLFLCILIKVKTSTIEY